MNVRALLSLILLASPMHTLFSRTIVTNKKLRASSEPYLSGDTFRAWADHIMESNTPSFSVENVKDGDVIFIKADYVRRFIRAVAPRISSRYILITHNSDEAITKKHLSFLNTPNLIAWLAQNVETHHPKLLPIPIGVANRYWKHGSIEALSHAQAHIAPKNRLLYMNINQNTHRERKKVYDHFKDKPFCTRGKRGSFETYLTEMSSHRFVLSPRGNGLDCHRTWEALLMGCIPIVKTSPLDPLFVDLPVIIIQDWSAITEEFLRVEYEKIKREKMSLDKAYALYWKNLITQLKKPSF